MFFVPFFLLESLVMWAQENNAWVSKRLTWELFGRGVHPSQVGQSDGGISKGLLHCIFFYWSDTVEDVIKRLKLQT